MRSIKEGVKQTSHINLAGLGLNIVLLDFNVTR
jgi:hypothetical protein